MPWYEYKGQKIEAQTPEAAKALIRNRLEGGEVDPTEGMSGMDKFLAGAGSGLTNVGRQAANLLLPESLEPEWATREAIERQRRTDAPLMQTGAGQAGRVAGEIAGALPLGGMAGAGARAAGMGGRVLPTAVEAATEGAILAGPDDRMGGAMLGGGIGGAFGAASKLGGGLMRGAKRTEGAQHLLDRGVDLTPGQMNPGGIMSTIEEGVSGRFSPAIQGARQRAELGTFRSILRESLPPGMNDVVGETAEDMLVNAYRGFDDAYDMVKGYAVRGDSDTLRNRLVDTLKKGAGTPETLAGEARWLDDLLQRGTNNTDELLAVRSELRGRIRDYTREGTVSARDAARTLRNVEEQITDLIEASLPPDAAAMLRLTDGQYGKYKIAEDMMARATDAGQPTPFQMAAAGKRGAPSAGAYARGEGPFRETTRAARESFRTGTPPTGMALALPLASTAIGGMTGGVGGAAAGLAGPAVAGHLLAGTRAGRRFMQGQYGAQRALSQTMDRIQRPLQYGGALARAGAVQQATEDY